MNRKVFGRHLKRGVEILLRQGPRAFLNKVRIKISEKKTVYISDRDEKTIAYDKIGPAETFEDKDGKPLLAVSLHLYYEDLLDEFVDYFNNIPFSFDLYVSIKDTGEKSKEKATRICKRFEDKVKNACKVVVKPAQNRGRDIAPMYVLFAKELKKYKYVMHLHSKKSLYTEKEQIGWRQYSVGSMIGSKEQSLRIISLLEENDDIGLVYPRRYRQVPVQALSWMSDEGCGREYMDSIGVPLRDGLFLFPAGSFFTVRNSAIKQIWDRNLKYEDFDEENGQTDGTLAHALERVLAQVVEYNGYHQAIIDEEHNRFFIDRDKNSFAEVFKDSSRKLLMDLSGYDVISFDIFDTLLTRVFLHPSDLFLYMQSVIADMGIKYKGENFAKSRAYAEVLAIEKRGASCDIDDIYEVFGELYKVEKSETEKLKELELDCEFNALIPRRDMVEMYHAAVDSGKKIIITSDMYLRRDFVERVLTKNGIRGYERLYISCEENKRKDDGSLWQQVLSDYKGKNLAHIGDNIRSDWQVLSDSLEHGVWILNPCDEEYIVPISFILQNDKKRRAGLVAGLTINGGIYNSPFALHPSGEPTFSDAYTLGYTVFGPLMYEYMTWLNDVVPDDAYLAFLAREGYVFQKIYETIYKEKAKEHCYFLASRRAVSVASIRSREDILGICRRDYDGDLKNLMISRLGVSKEAAAKLPDKYVHFKEGMPDDEYELTMKLVEPFFDEIIKRAEVERENYLSYYDMIIPDDKKEKTVFVDIGYAGTIQYYLCRLFDKPVTGAYMAVFDEHPGIGECSAKTYSMYKKGKAEFADVIDKTQLFLESVLQAPYGQLLYIDGKEPVYKEEKERRHEIAELQEGMISYAAHRSAFATGNDSGEREYMERIYKGFIFGGYIDERTADVFTVEDSYSQDTTLHYDYSKGKWSI